MVGQEARHQTNPATGGQRDPDHSDHARIKTMSGALGPKCGSAFIPWSGDCYRGVIKIDGQRRVAVIQQDGDGTRLTLHDVLPPVPVRGQDVIE
jgi:hypothetical protein